MLPMRKRPLTKFCTSPPFYHACIIVCLLFLVVSFHDSLTFGGATHTEMTRLSQPWHKVATMLFYNLVTTLAQPCILKLSQGCDKVVRTLSQGCDKVVRTLSQGCPNIVTRLPQCNLVTTLYFETVARL